MKLKKRLLVLAAIVACLAILGLGSAAYFSTRATAHNVITTGEIAIAVVEQQRDGGQLLPYPDQPIAIMPGTTVSKIVSVRSDEAPAYIRMKYTVSACDEHGDLIPGSLDGIVSIDAGSANWVEKDGWWYYTRTLDAGQTTEPLFESVSFSGTGMGNAYQNATLTIFIHAQAVQAANNPAPDGDVTAVSGWPKE